ncbi:hypothetical protein [Clostridium sp. Ade.TY]|uniref:hypothetical protein n=1 Tax=Clostridium sp. Ade.TY TaxID=1391647 RepID=UPI000463FA57|nr:hypothetical protein [Clostridium sp. Ade.TY]
MRKIIISILICLFFLVGCSNSKFPKTYPKMTIEYNGENFETKANEVTWAETYTKGESIGSSLISMPEVDIAKEMDFINVNPKGTINFKLEYDKDISEIFAVSVEGTGLDRKEIPIDITENSIKVPNEKGDYIYSIKVTWDSTPQSTHFVSYVFKLRVV